MVEKTDWTGFQNRYDKHREDMKSIMESIRDAVDPEEKIYENDMTDRGFVFFTRDREGSGIAVSLEIWDSGDDDDDEIFGQRGNFVLKGVKDGGQILFDIVPDNYSDRVWAPYENDEMWNDKFDTVKKASVFVPNRIREEQMEDD